MKNNFFEGFKNLFNGVFTGGAAHNIEQLQDNIDINNLETQDDVTFDELIAKGTSEHKM